MTYIQPLTLLFLCLCLWGVWRLRPRGPRKPWWPAAVGTLGLAALSFQPVAWLFAQPLECSFPRTAIPGGEAEAIVVLSAGVIEPAPDQPLQQPDPETYQRCGRAAWLYHNWRALPVLASGGGSHHAEPFAATMRRVLVAMGVPEDMIWTEERSLSTHENARFGAGILRRKGIRRIALVTSAFHMLRSERCFRKEGLVVLPAPCGFYRLEAEPDTLIPGWKGIYTNERTLHEMAGLLAYWIRGWI